MSRAERIAALHAAARERILVLDGAWGVMIQRSDLSEEDFRGDRFAGHNGQMKGNNDILCLTRPDVVAMDLMMPKLDGIEATRIIRKGGGNSASTPIIGLTAHALPHELENLTQAGMQNCLIKPLRKRNLQKMLGSFRETRESEASSDVSRTTVIDRSVLDELAELLPAEKLKRRVDDFLKELSESEKALQAHFEAGQWPELAALAHRCAGSAATFGAVELASAMRGVQTAAQEDRIAELEAAMHGVGAIAGRTREALVQYSISEPDKKSD